MVRMWSLSDRLGMAAERSVLPARSPYPLIQPWTWVTPGLHRHQRVGHGAAGVVVAVDAELRARALPHVRHRLPDVVGQGAAVRVAQHQRFGPRFLGRGEDGEGEVRVAPVAVEEVLGVEEDA